MRLLTAKAAADYLGIPLRTFYYFVQQGRIARYVMGPRVTRYEQSDLDAFLKSCRCETFDKIRVKNVRLSSSTVSPLGIDAELEKSFLRLGVKLHPKRRIEKPK